jgi:hypothetical protein
VAARLERKPLALPEALTMALQVGDALDQAVADFSIAYADQNEKDHAAFDRAVRKGTVAAAFEEDR